MKRMLTLILAACLVLTLCACGGKATVEGKGFDTPEEALIAYAEALKEGDVNKILSTFAIETHLANYDLEEQIDRVRAYSTGNEYLFSDLDPYTHEANLIRRQYLIARNLDFMYLNYALGEKYTGQVITISGSGDYTSASKLLRELEQDDWMEILADMEIGDILDYRDFDIEKDLWKNTEKKVLRPKEEVLGCDELACLGLEITLDGDDYCLLMEIACYDGKWYNCNLGGGALGALAGVSPTSGGIMPW